jgi:hypothetical protein
MIYEFIYSMYKVKSYSKLPQFVATLVCRGRIMYCMRVCGYGSTVLVVVFQPLT